MRGSFKLSKICGVFGPFRVLGPAFAGLAVTTFVAPAEALEPPRTAGVVQLGAGFRYGLSLDDPFLDPWRAGLGLELGYTTPGALYLGTVFDYFFGESRPALTGSMSANLWQIAAEGGYDFQLSEAVLVRPKVGVGLATVTLDCTECEASGTESSFAAAPGLTAMFFLGKVTLSFDTRFQMVFADPEMLKALIFSFGIGF